MRILADLINEAGRGLEDRKWLRSADWAYALASWISPSWSVPWYNRGLMAKWARRWPESLRFNRKATELDPKNQPAWWNLGIAATALEEWPSARAAWQGFGIDLPDGSGPLQMNLGAVPIRIDPHGRAEVVWCDRLDPARAQIRSVPFPESGRRFGDLLLTDGQPVGSRHFQGRQISVFNEIQLLKPGDRDIYGVEVTAPTQEDSQALEELARSTQGAAEDWSTVRVLCKACSEGLPHEHDTVEDETRQSWQPDRQFGIAARSEAEVASLLSAWQKGAAGRVVGQWQRLPTRTEKPASA